MTKISPSNENLQGFLHVKHLLRWNLIVKKYERLTNST